MMLDLRPAEAISLRPYQSDAVDMLRECVRRGLKRPVLCAGTGAGKTVIASHLLREADAKGSYALFLVDRVELVKQTSATLDRYGIAHGVVQGIHERWLPHENVQVCSIQTLERRSLPRRPSLIIYDEAHCSYRKTLRFIKDHPDAVAIGLTATPFTKGMGAHWDTIVNVISTRALIEAGFLVEPTIYVARSPEDAELAVSGMGEFTDASAAGAGIQIIGDVVAEWISKTTEHFGGPAKTIVFSPTVEHGRELCAAFADAGFNFQHVSYLDRNEAERDAKIAEFRRPDSIIHGLVSCGVLTKGFDVPDVKCIATGQRVLTDQGLVPIEKVTLDHKLWDGIEWVSHQGVVFKGYQHVIEYAGLVATAGHEVETAQGWRAFGDCAAEQIGIAQTGLGERPVRRDENRFARNYLEEERTMGPRARSLRLRQLQSALRPGTWPFALATTAARVSAVLSGAGQGTRFERPAGLVNSSCKEHEVPLSEAVARCVAGLRRAWDRVSFPVGASLCGMGCAELGFAQARPEHSDRPRGQQRPLRARQPSLGLEGAQLQQYPAWRVGRNDASVSHGAPGDQICGQDASQSLRNGFDVRSGGGAILSSIRQAQRPVWDILQAGPRNRFTCEGLLVHNCGISCKPYRKSLSSHMQEIGRIMRPYPGKDKAIWLCHSGNVERFAIDTYDVWQNGAGDLSQATKRDATPRKREPSERAKVVCPECAAALHGDTCRACGWQRPARSGIHAVDGALHAFDMAAQSLAARPGLRAECLNDPHRVWHAALSHCLANSRYGEDKARRWAAGVWHGIYPAAKLPAGWYGAAPGPVGDAEAALIEREIQRFRKSRRAA